jgi:transcriptional regulator with XRE-family HTH domain
MEYVTPLTAKKSTVSFCLNICLTCFMAKAVNEKNRFKPLLKREAEVCKRVAARRRYTGLSQRKFAALVGLSRDQLNNLESERVPLRFDVGWKICRALNLNPLWLALGTGLEQPFVEIDLGPHLPEIGERALFTDACEGVLYEDFENAIDAKLGITASEAFPILKPEWINGQKQRAKDLRKRAAALVKQAEEIELAISESEDFHKRQRKKG